MVWEESRMHIGRTAAIVDLGALKKNMATIRSRLPEGTEVCAVVKANGYGHGAVGIYPALKESGVDRYAVAVWQEGRTLREAGVTEPIHILGSTPDEEMDEVVRYGLTPTLFTESMAESLNEACRKAVEEGSVPADYRCGADVKLDTGMGRIGFPCEDSTVEVLCRMHSLPYIRLEGLFTHFARADEADKSDALSQMDRFRAMEKKLADNGVVFPRKHLQNSAAIMEMSEAGGTMVRPGIILYGIYPSDEVNREAFPLVPVLSWVSHVSFVKEVPAGTPISYGGTFVTKRPSRIATVPVGYADGYRRDLSNRGVVQIGDQLAPVVGRICMDQFMVDVTDLPPVRRGDTVWLIGEKVTAEDMASAIGTIPYEIVCGISERVPRLYVDGQQAVSTP